jgi:hypothetical protein
MSDGVRRLFLDKDTYSGGFVWRGGGVFVLDAWMLDWTGLDWTGLLGRRTRLDQTELDYSI